MHLIILSAQYIKKAREALLRHYHGEKYFCFSCSCSKCCARLVTVQYLCKFANSHHCLNCLAASLTYRNEYLSPSLWTQLVQLMQQANTDTGTCGPGGCYIRLDSNNLKFLREHERFIDESGNPCLVYTCTVRL